MDLNGNKYSDKEEEEEEDDDFNDGNVPNVRSLKLFFQNQKQPIIGFKPLSDNRLESSNHSNHSSDESNEQSIDSLDNNVINRSNRLIPRPPKAIQSCDIRVSPFLKSLVSNQCDGSINPMSSLPPVPKPRKSLQNKNTVNCSDIKSNVNETKANDMSIEAIKKFDSELKPNSLIDSLTKEFKELNSSQRNVKTSSLHFLQTTDPVVDYNRSDQMPETSGLTSEKPFLVTINSIESNVKIPEKPNRNKSKKPFKSFKTKLLSLRRMSAQNSSKKRQKPDSTANSQIKPLKPTRLPPKPPVLHFRPPAPLPPPEPSEDYYEDTISGNNESDNRLVGGYELYSDSVDTERIYCSLDNEDEEQSDSDIYEGIDDYDDGLTHRSDTTYICDNYYGDNAIDDFDDCQSEPLYEVLPFERDLQTDSDSIASNSTVSLDDNQNQLETNSKVEFKQMAKSEQKFDAFDRKRNLKAIKLKKKFNLRGDEVPVNAGIVKEDHKGNRYDLYVRKGETVLIMRMEGNPPGKWLAKNERSKIGFVDLQNISFDAESVKTIIKSLSSHQS